MSVFGKLEKELAASGLTMSDVVKMNVFPVGDPAKGGAMDFEGLMKVNARHFGTSTNRAAGAHDGAGRRVAGSWRARRSRTRRRQDDAEVKAIPDRARRAGRQPAWVARLPGGATPRRPRR